MVHLSIACTATATGAVALDTEAARAAFLLGSVSPDSIHMREGSTREDKRRIHLFDDATSLRLRFRSIDGLWSEAVESWSSDGATDGVRLKEKQAFLAGYCTHLAADALWSHLLVRSYHQAQIDGSSPEEYRRTYYRETDKADFRIFHTAPWREDVWRLLRAARTFPFLDYLTADEIGRWRDRTLAFFEDPDKEPEDEPDFFTPQRIERFLEVAADACAAGLRDSFAPVGEKLDRKYEVGALAGRIEG